MKKRVFSLLTAICILLSVSACAPKEVPPAATPEPTPTPSGSGTQEAVVPEDIKSGVETVTIDGVEFGMGLIMAEEEGAMDENPEREIDRAVEPIKPVPDEMLDGTALSEDFYYYRSTLDATEQQAYDLLRAGMLEGEAKIAMTVPIDKSRIFDIYKKIVFDSPEMFWAEAGLKYWYNQYNVVTFVEPKYNDLVEDIAGNTAIFEAAAEEALADMWSLTTDVERAKYAHDYLTHTIDYTYDSEYNQTAYSAIVNCETVCAGYAHAFQYFMQQMGIPCAYVLGYVQGGYHAWNLLLLDGDYYVMDVTWDDPLGAPSDYYSYDYFNITDDEMSWDHLRADESMPLPWAEGVLCSFYEAFGGEEYGTDFDGIIGYLPEPEPEQPEDEEPDNPYLG